MTRAAWLEEEGMFPQGSAEWAFIFWSPKHQSGCCASFHMIQIWLRLELSSWLLFKDETIQDHNYCWSNRLLQCFYWFLARLLHSEKNITNPMKKGKREENCLFKFFLELALKVASFQRKPCKGNSSRHIGNKGRKCWSAELVVTGSYVLNQ